jgi:hypothetical protein
MGCRHVVACSPRRAVVARSFRRITPRNAVVARSPCRITPRHAVVARSPCRIPPYRAGFRYVNVPDRLTRQSTGYDGRVPSETQQLNERGLGPAQDIR